jgi:simple sugar transport system permease protein
MMFLEAAFWFAVLRITVPYALAALGGVVQERAGVVALGLEGKLLGGAFMATVGAHLGGPLLGVAAGVAGGLLVGAAYELAVVRGRADQIVASIAMNLLVLGLTRYGLQLLFGSASTSGTVDGFATVWASWIFIVLALALTAAVHVFLARTPRGLRLRAAGDHPDAAASLGVDVGEIRWSACLIAGALAGLGGAWMALDISQFSDKISAGHGYIALAAVIFGGWRPVPAALACLLFGFANALQIHLPNHVSGIPHGLLSVLPYVITLLALPSIAGRARAPAALGRPR